MHEQAIHHTKEELRVEVFNKVFKYMFFGLLLSVAAGYLALNTSLRNYIFSGYVFIGLLIFEVLLVFFISARLGKMSYGASLNLFFLYSFVNGLTLSVIFVIYTVGSILNALGATALLFGIMAFVGYTTKKDMSKLGPILLIGLITIIIMGVVNWFLQNPLIYWIVTIVGILIFLGLTMYDVNRINKWINSGRVKTQNDIEIIAISGALSLYLDFINLLLLILRLLGKRRR